MFCNEETLNLQRVQVQSSLRTNQYSANWEHLESQVNPKAP